MCVTYPHKHTQTHTDSHTTSQLHWITKKPSKREKMVAGFIFAFEKNSICYRERPKLLAKLEMKRELSLAEHSPANPLDRLLGGAGTDLRSLLLQDSGKPKQPSSMQLHGWREEKTLGRGYFPMTKNVGTTKSPQIFRTMVRRFVSYAASTIKMFALKR